MLTAIMPETTDRIDARLTNQEILIPPAKVAEMTGFTVGTLSVWRSTGRCSLPYVKLGRKVMYRLQDVLDFIKG
jgi:hypothetical protein